MRTSTASRRSSGVARTGAYGGYYVIQRLFDAGKIKWGWQTYAWSGGQWDSRAQLRQVQNGIAGGQMDEDTSEADDFGQWGHGTPAPPDQPKGYLDQATCAAIAGWAQDPQVPTTSIFTDVYYDGAAGAAGAVGIRLTASISRPDLCTAIGSCDHGFSMPAPRSLLDGHAHEVYAYGINHTSGGLNTLLTDSPKSFTCAAPAIAAGAVKRHVTSPTILSDWRFDTFTDMAPYTTAEIAAVPDGVDLGSAPKIVQVTGDPAVYVADETYRRHIVNPDSLSAWRLTGADVKAITAAELAALTAGPDWPLAPLLAKDPAAAGRVPARRAAAGAGRRRRGGGHGRRERRGRRGRRRGGRRHEPASRRRRLALQRRRRERREPRLERRVRGRATRLPRRRRVAPRRRRRAVLHRHEAPAHFPLHSPTVPSNAGRMNWSFCSGRQIFVSSE